MPDKERPHPNNTPDAPGVVLTPGAVATLPELQAAGFHYIK